jgi:hypothetical protein
MVIIIDATGPGIYPTLSLLEIRVRIIGLCLFNYELHAAAWNKSLRYFPLVPSDCLKVTQHSL